MKLRLTKGNKGITTRMSQLLQLPAVCSRLHNEAAVMEVRSLCPRANCILILFWGEFYKGRLHMDFAAVWFRTVWAGGYFMKILLWCTLDVVVLLCCKVECPRTEYAHILLICKFDYAEIGHGHVFPKR